MLNKKNNLLFNLLLLGIFAAFLQLPCEHSLAEDKEMQDDDKITLRLLIVPEKNIFEQRRRYKFITDYLSYKTDINFIVEIMASYGDISKAFIEGKADAGFFGSFSYVLTHAKTGIEPIARPVWPNNNSTYRGYIFTRKDSNIKTIKDMRNKSLVLVDKATTAGYIYQLFYFKYFGISNIEDYFSSISFANSHDAAAWAVYAGEADIGGSKNHIFNNIMEEHPDFKEQMIILGESPEIPSNGLAVRKDLNPAIKLRIKTLLLSLHETPEGKEILKNFGAIKFVATSNDDYAVVYNMVKELGIDLHEYSYKR
ncbi:phosphate/phosphite/phosphonate ABC transporter substrate-binding protein [Thermodesulfobacteriota bacterium]